MFLPNQEFRNNYFEQELSNQFQFHFDSDDKTLNNQTRTLRLNGFSIASNYYRNELNGHTHCINFRRNFNN